MKFQPINRSQVVAALKAAGPMTATELAEYLGWESRKVTTTIGSTRWLLPEQVLRIVRYVPVTGRRGRDLAVYAAEAGADAPKPAVNAARRRKQTEARYRHKHRAIINARNQASSSAKRGAPAINPWAQLASPVLRGTMAAVAR
jgi:hypothetical protein